MNISISRLLTSMIGKLLISQKQSPREEIRHNGFLYPLCRNCYIFMMDPLIITYP